MLSIVMLKNGSTMRLVYTDQFFLRVVMKYRPSYCPWVFLMGVTSQVESVMLSPFAIRENLVLMG